MSMSQLTFNTSCLIPIKKLVKTNNFKLAGVAKNLQLCHFMGCNNVNLCRDFLQGIEKSMIFSPTIMNWSLVEPNCLSGTSTEACILAGFFHDLSYKP